MGGFGVGGGAGGGGALASLTGTQNMQELQESLKGAPADILAAAERLSLIATTTDPSSSVVRTEPSSESTDTGMLSVSEREASVAHDREWAGGKWPGRRGRFLLVLCLDLCSIDETCVRYRSVLSLLA